MKAATVIFDLGNVLFPFDLTIITRKLAGIYGLDHDFAFRQIFSDRILTPFEEGRVSAEEFTRHCSEALGVTLEPAAFREIWCDIFTENGPVVEIVHRLKPVARLLALSNANVWHIEHVKERYPVMRLFDAVIASYEVGFCKPDSRIYQKAIELSGPGQIIYVDDIEKYVRAAEPLGIRGIHYVKPEDLSARLARFGLLQA